MSAKNISCLLEDGNDDLLMEALNNAETNILLAIDEDVFHNIITPDPIIIIHDSSSEEETFVVSDTRESVIWIDDDYDHPNDYDPDLIWNEEEMDWVHNASIDPTISQDEILVERFLQQLEEEEELR